MPHNCPLNQLGSSELKKEMQEEVSLTGGDGRTWRTWRRREDVEDAEAASGPGGKLV